MKVAVGLFITLAVLLNSIQLSSEANMSELFPPSERLLTYPPPLEELKYVEHREQLGHLRRFDANNVSAEFDETSILLKRDTYIIGWNQNGIIKKLYAVPTGIYDLSRNIFIEVSNRTLQELGVSHPFVYVRCVDETAACHAAAAIPVRADLPTKIAAHHEAGIAANARALDRVPDQRQVLRFTGAVNFQAGFSGSLTVIRRVYDQAYVTAYKRFFGITI